MLSFTAYQQLLEGVYDPGIFKCVFMAGGPGSGKSHTADELFGLDAQFKSSFSHYGLKVVNSDKMFEYLLKQMHISPKDLADIQRRDPASFLFLTQDPTGPRGRAKDLTDKQQDYFLAGRLGVIIDGTGDNYLKIEKKKQQMEALGYDTSMVFVNTTLDVALERNRMRSRQLPDALVTEIWQSCQHNRAYYRRLFGSDYLEVYNNKNGVPHPLVQRAIAEFMRRPIQNTIGKQWVHAHLHPVHIGVPA